MNRCDSFAHLFPQNRTYISAPNSIHMWIQPGANLGIKPVGESFSRQKWSSCQGIQGWGFIEDMRTRAARGLIEDMSFVGSSQSTLGFCQAPFYRCPLIVSQPEPMRVAKPPNLNWTKHRTLNDSTPPISLNPCPPEKLQNSLKLR